MARSSLISILIVTISLLTLISPTTSPTPTIHELLQIYGLPAGIFPKAVEYFNLDLATGKLEVHLKQPCYVTFEGLAHFDKVVHGNLSFGELSQLEGISEEELFIWLPIFSIKVVDPSSGLILIDTGLLQKKLVLTVFEMPQDCRMVGVDIGHENTGSRRATMNNKKRGSSA